MKTPWVIGLLLAGCSTPTFDPPSLVNSVRIIATRADTPYAQPGATVNMQVLAVDGRSAPTEPMRVSWLSTPCINPEGDAYYSCFPRFAETLRPKVSLDTKLTQSETFSFQMPEDVIETHVDATGQGAYGLAVVFSFACAGNVQYRPDLASSPDAVPFACVDAAGQRLGANDFVFAYSLVYSFSDRTNQNPTLESVTYDGAPIDPEAGLTVQHCGKSSIDDCSAVKLDVNLTNSSQELDPGNADPRGKAQRETLYARYYVTGGKIANDLTVIFDAHDGRLDKTGNDLRAPRSPGAYDLWAVIHDNRGGAVWQHVPLTVE